MVRFDRMIGKWNKIGEGLVKERNGEGYIE